MIIEKKEFYLRVSQIASLDDILYSSDKIKENIDQLQSAVVVFSFTEEPKSDEKSRDTFAHFVFGLSAVTVAESNNFSGFSFEFLTLFDKLISAEKCTINNISASQSYGTDFMKRYRIVYGRKAAYDLKKYISDCSGQSFTLSCITVPEYEGSIQEKTDMYLNSLFKEKTEFQINSIAACFIKARKEGTAAALNEESIRFYSLVKRISEEHTDGK